MERSSCRVAQNQVIKRLVTTWPCFEATQRLMHRQPVALSPKRLEASSMPSQVGSYIVKSTITTLPKSGNMAPLKDFLLHSCIVIPALIVLYIFSRFLHQTSRIRRQQLLQTCVPQVLIQYTISINEVCTQGPWFTRCSASACASRFHYPSVPLQLFLGMCLVRLSSSGEQ